jgi:hypothetical protein
MVGRKSWRHLSLLAIEDVGLSYISNGQGGDIRNTHKVATTTVLTVVHGGHEDTGTAL